MYKTIVFDVDGTLLDSSNGIKESIKYTIQKQGLQMLCNEKLNEFVGFSPLYDAFKYFCNLNDKEAQDCCKIYRKYYKDEKLYKQSCVYNGIYELLDYLKENQYNLGVATYKREDYAISLMKHFDLNQYFDSICGSDNENKLKKIDILQNCLKNLTLENSKVIMVGDSYHDAEAADILGIDFIGVTYGFGFKNVDECNKYKNILVAKHPLDILNFIKKKEEL